MASIQFLKNKDNIKQRLYNMKYPYEFEDFKEKKKLGYFSTGFPVNKNPLFSDFNNDVKDLVLDPDEKCVVYKNRYCLYIKDYGTIWSFFHKDTISPEEKLDRPEYIESCRKYLGETNLYNLQDTQIYKLDIYNTDGVFKVRLSGLEIPKVGDYFIYRKRIHEILYVEKDTYEDFVTIKLISRDSNVKFIDIDIITSE